MEKNKEKLYKTMLKQARQSNIRLLQLRAQLGTQYSWAGKRLIDYLSADIVNGISEKGFVKFNKNMSIPQMRAVIKATDRFLASKTSTPEGVISNIQTIKREIGLSFKVSSQTAESIFNFFKSDEYKENSEVKYEQLKIAAEVSSKGGDFETYVNRVKNYMLKGPDDDMKRELRPIFDLVNQKGIDSLKNLSFNNVRI